MAKEESIVTLKKECDIVVNLLTLIGAEKLSVDDRTFFMNFSRDEKNKTLCLAVEAACKKVIEHLDSIKTFITMYLKRD